MKRMGRTEIVCAKRLPSGATEQFTVVVKSEEVDKAIKNYKEQGYTVFSK